MATEEAIDMLSEAIHERNYVKAGNAALTLRMKYGLNEDQMYSLAKSYTGISFSDWNALMLKPDDINGS
jgi:hypothetical protein